MYDVLITIVVRHTFATLLLSPSLTPPGAGSVHPLQDLLLQSGQGRSLAVAPFPSLDLLCGTVCHLNFGSSTVVLHFVDG